MPALQPVLGVNSPYPKPVSIASASGGADKYDPRTTALRNARTRLSQATQLQGAARDTNDQRVVGQANVLRGLEDQQYAQLGVPAPTTTNVPMGGNTDLGPFARTSLRTREELLAEKFNEQNQITAAQDDIAAAQESLKKDSTSGRTGLSLGSHQGTGKVSRGAFGSQPGDIGSGNWFGLNDPRSTNFVGTGNTAASLAEQDAEQRGLVSYRDPFNPSTPIEYVTPAEAAIRDEMDKEKLGTESMGRQGPLATLSDDMLLQEFVETGDETLRAELKRRGFSDQAITTLTTRIQRVKSEAAAKKKVESDFDQTSEAALIDGIIDEPDNANLYRGELKLIGYSDAAIDFAIRTEQRARLARKKQSTVDADAEGLYGP